jgi:hypothetical protein
MSRAAKKSNEKLLEQAERILQLAELNRRMLTEKEKVNSFTLITEMKTIVLYQ